MDAATDTVNLLFHLAGSRCTFTFAQSKKFGPKQSLEEVIYSTFRSGLAAQQLYSMIKLRLLAADNIIAAFEAAVTGFNPELNIPRIPKEEELQLLGGSSSTRFAEAISAKLQLSETLR
jgi:hypothetical protein